MDKTPNQKAEVDYTAGMKYKEIADKYNVSINTVKSWKTRCNWSKKGAHKKEEKECTQNNKNSTPNEIVTDASKGKYFTDVEPKLALIEGWTRNGLIEEQVAKNLGISYSTFRNYKNRHLALLTALKKGKEVIDLEVENALLKRALGYKYKETTKEANETGNLVVTKEVTKEMAPDTTAQIFWLKNRKPIEWREKKEIEHSGTINNPYEGLSIDELKRLINDV